MKRLFRRRRYRLLLIVAVVCTGVAASGGCGTIGYVVSVAGGQLDIVLGTRPIEKVLASGELDEKQADRLRLIQDVRQFGIDRMGLDAGRSYTGYYDTAGRPPAWNLSASRKDAFEAFTWSLPVIGELPYLGYFSEGEAELEAEMLKADGFDVLLAPVAAYSTLGFFADPVFSSMLDRDEVTLTELILHEMTHSTIFRRGDIDFNESLATFIGRAGAIRFLSERDGPDAPLVEVARNFQEDADRYNAFLAHLYDELDTFYRTPLSSIEKIAGREAVYRVMVDEFAAVGLAEFHFPKVYERIVEMELNNAWILANRRYNLDLDLFARVHETTGEDFCASLDVFSDAADSDDPKAFLRQWLVDRGAP